MTTIRDIDQIFLDIDGVLMLSDLPIPGGTATVKRLRSLGIKVSFVTNTTRKPRQLIHEDLLRLGFNVDLEDVVCPAIIARERILQLKRPTVALYVNDEVMQDFEGLKLNRRRAGAVVMGDLGSEFSPEILDEIFKLAFSGSELFALHKNRFWRDPSGLRLDLGPYVAAIEYATGKAAEIVGKPSPGFFRGLLQRYKIRAENTLMVGDDIEADIQGAKRVGIKTVLVKTGKYDFDFVKRSGIKPDAIVPSIADLCPALGIETK
ncbi:MAG: TIGR01458 family HAD-type hydrolase [Candidatus Electryonea clarkiae]|nr:TIGR01458 family HAD-type hydrolase [Candidatus Electryonea clarkiae]MDP8286305.1 TIGR01458 family HAD-type hydrolase [Candidatus Electryonea clarkiae]